MSEREKEERGREREREREREKFKKFYNEGVVLLLVRWSLAFLRPYTTKPQYTQITTSLSPRPDDRPTEVPFKVPTDMELIDQACMFLPRSPPCDPLPVIVKRPRIEEEEHNLEVMTSQHNLDVMTSHLVTSLSGAATAGALMTNDDGQILRALLGVTTQIPQDGVSKSDALVGLDTFIAFMDQQPSVAGILKAVLHEYRRYAENNL